MKRPNVYRGRWAKVRLSFLNENPLCVMCKEQGRITAATVVDHIIPHRLRDALASGDTEWIAKAQKLFWDTNNYQSLCASHHNSTKQRMEKSGVVVGCSEDGIPLDPNSHWNK
ncbi:HNH endonuclease [Providencia rettgeri]